MFRRFCNVGLPTIANIHTICERMLQIALGCMLTNSLISKMYDSIGGGPVAYDAKSRANTDAINLSHVDIETRSMLCKNGCGSFLGKRIRCRS